MKQNNFKDLSDHSFLTLFMKMAPQTSPTPNPIFSNFCWISDGFPWLFPEFSRGWSGAGVAVGMLSGDHLVEDANLPSRRCKHNTYHIFKGYALCRQPLLASWDCHLGGLVPPFWYSGRQFWHLGAPWGTILAPHGVHLYSYFSFGSSGNVHGL